MGVLEEAAFPKMCGEGHSGVVRRLRDAHDTLHKELSALGEAISEGDALRVEHASHRLNETLMVHRATERAELTKLTAPRAR